MDDLLLAKAEDSARELLRKAFLDDNIESSVYCDIHDLYTLIIQLNEKPNKKFWQFWK